MPPEIIDLIRSDKEWLLNGGSSVIGPDGHYILEPQYHRQEIIYAEIKDLNACIDERMTLDVSGLIPGQMFLILM